jgi:hypothetical protein
LITRISGGNDFPRIYPRITRIFTDLSVYKI